MKRAIVVLCLCLALAGVSLAAQEIDPSERSVVVKERIAQIYRADARPRVAMVIGNSDYVKYPLKNPVNDAMDMAKMLNKLGFKVKLLQNAKREEMVKWIGLFERNLERDGVALFYYAGHGMQIDGVNYMVPIEADPGSEVEARGMMVSVDLVLGAMSDKGKSLNLVILDACRNNPFKRSWSARGDGSKGLAQMMAPSGSLIAYATAPGEEAEDGKGRNGVYTGCLLKHIQEPNLDIAMMFRKVREDVEKETSHLKKPQTPWESSSIKGQFCFYPMPKLSAKELEGKEDDLSKYQRQMLEKEQKEKEEREIMLKKAKELDDKIAEIRKKLSQESLDPSGDLEELEGYLTQKEATAERLEALRKEQEREEAKRRAELERLKRERIARVKEGVKKSVEVYGRIVKHRFCDEKMKKEAWKRLLKGFPDWWKAEDVAECDLELVQLSPEERSALVREREQKEREQKEGEQTDNGRYWVSPEGVIRDTKTGLDWYVGPDRDTTWYEAKRFARSLTLAGGGWHLPKVEELRVIYEPGKGSRNMDPVFKTSGWWVWADDGGDSISSSAPYFYFDGGIDSMDDRGNSVNRRGVAVRRGRQ